MKYRSKPVVIEAEQFLANGVDTKPVRGMTLWSDTDGPTPRDMSWGFVVTIHGQRAHVQHGDYIIPEPDGVHFHPCKPDIFEAKYEPVEDATRAEPLEPNGGNLYRPHKVLITSGRFWRCAHGLTGLDGNGAWAGCDDCAKDDPQAYARFHARTNAPEPLSEFNEPGFDADGPTDDELKERRIIEEDRT